MSNVADRVEQPTTPIKRRLASISSATALVKGVFNGGTRTVARARAQVLTRPLGSIRASDRSAVNEPIAPTPSVGIAVIEAARQFLYREARLLDERRFAEWLDLWAPDARYSMPTRTAANRNSGESFGAELTGPDGVWWFDDTAAELAARVAKLASGKSWAEAPPSRTRRFVSNVEVELRQSASLLVRSNVLIYRGRKDFDTEWYSVSHVDQFDCADSAAAQVSDVNLGPIRSRTVILDTNVIKADNLVMFL